jgi:ferrochelatase
VLQPFYDQPEYIDALVASARPHLEQDYDHLLLSFHGLPERHLKKLDPTGKHASAADCCRRQRRDARGVLPRAMPGTAKAFAQKMGMPDGKWSVSFQSRLGRAKWIEPYTERAWMSWPRRREKAAGDVPGVRRRLHRDAGRDR